MKRWMVLGWMVVLTGCPPKAPSAGSSGDLPPQAQTVDVNRPVHDRVNEAADLIESGEPADLERAVFLLRGAVDEDPTGVAQFNLGLAHQARGELDTARATLEAVVGQHPQMGDAWRFLGEIRVAQGRPLEGEAVFRSGMAADPEHIGLRVSLIELVREQGRPEEAIALSKEALKVNANSLAVYNNFALSYLDLGDTTLARFILQKALQSVEGAVQNAYLHANLGWSYYLDGNKPSAVEALKKAVELDPDLVPALVYLSRVYLDDRNYEDMVPLLEAAEGAAPTNADVQLNLGIAYRGMGRFDEARQAYEQTLTLSPGNPDPHFNLGILMSDHIKDYDGAVAAFNRYLQAGGTERERAETYIKEVEREKARAERRAKAEAERKRREEERARREQLLKEAEEGAAQDQPEADGSAPPDGEEEPNADDTPVDDAPQPSPSDGGTP